MKSPLQVFHMNNGERIVVSDPEIYPLRDKVLAKAYKTWIITVDTDGVRHNIQISNISNVEERE